MSRWVDSLFDAISSAFSTSRVSETFSLTGKAGTEFLHLGLNSQTLSGTRMGHYDMMTIPTVFRGIDIISNAVARVPFYVFKVNEDGTREFAKRHTSWNSVTVEPNPEIKKIDFYKTMTAWAIQYGNAVAHIHRPNWPIGGPIEFTPLLPDRTNVVRITERMAKRHNIAEDLIGELYYETQINSENFAFPASECIHIRGLGPNPYWGWDVCMLLVEALGGAKAKAEFGHRFYGQGANPAGFIEAPVGLSEEAAKRFSESMKRGLEGIGRAHRIMLLEENAKFHQWTIDPEKAQFIEGLQFDYRTIANVLRIKVHKLIDSANSSYNSLEMAESEHKSDDLLPWVEQWCGEFNKKLLTERQRFSLSHEIAPDDEFVEGFIPYADRVEGVIKLHTNDIITRDEGRRRVNFGPSNDKDGDRFVIPSNMDFADDRSMLVSNSTIASNQTDVPKLPAPEDDTEDTDEGDDGEDAVSFIVEPGPTIDEIVASVSDVSCIVDNGWEENLTTTEDHANMDDYEDVKQSLSRMIDQRLASTRKRLRIQASKLASSNMTKFISWVDELNPDTVDVCMQGQMDQMVTDIQHGLQAILSRPIEASCVPGAIDDFFAGTEVSDSGQDENSP